MQQRRSLSPADAAAAAREYANAEAADGSRRARRRRASLARRLQAAWRAWREAAWLDEASS